MAELSSYAEHLSAEEKTRYKAKISELGEDPYLLTGSYDIRQIPNVSFIDILQYLVLKKSAYTDEEFRAYKSIDAYKNYRSGFLKSLEVYRKQDFCMLLSQIDAANTIQAFISFSNDENENERKVKIWNGEFKLVLYGVIMDSSTQFKPGKKKHPQASANIISKLTYCWTLPIFLTGYKRDLGFNDLPKALDEHSSSKLGDHLEKLWNREVVRASQRGKKPSLFKVLCKIYWFKLLIYGIVSFIYSIVLRLSTPILLSYLLEYFSQTDDEQGISKNMAYWYAAGVIATQGLYIIISQPYAFGTLHLGVKLKVSTISLIYRKALKLNKLTGSLTTSGQVINLMSNDANRFEIAFLFLHHLWVGPVQAVIITYILWEELQFSTLIGLFILISFIPINAFMARVLSALRLKTAIRTDERVRLMNEIIQGIQVIKMYTWEKPFAILMDAARKKEVKYLRKAGYIKGWIFYSVLIFQTRSAIFFTILSYVLFGNRITAVKVFVLTSFYNTLRENLTEFFPLAANFLAECLVSVKRVEQFLLLSENLNKEGGDGSNFDNSKDTKKDKVNGLKTDKPNYNQTVNATDNLGVFLKNASAKWSADIAEDTITNVTFDARPRLLTAIIGPVGSGKTSLFHAILRELPLTRGSIEVNGSMSYASQEPWLFQGSVRQNILFGLEFDRDRYHRVVKACCLKPDFEQLPYGDKTIVGERGTSLSGGQRARVNLARACYREADIYLLDDPLSAVDSHVGKHLFENCIKGLLKDKTVLLITHQLQHLVNADQVILLEDGEVKAMGDFTTLQYSGIDFASYLKSDEGLDEGSRKGKDEGQARSRPPTPDSTLRMRSNPLAVYGSHRSLQSITTSHTETGDQRGPVEEDEMHSFGKVSGKVYKSYFKSCGSWNVLFWVIFMCIIAQALASGSDYWITYWVNLEEYFSSKNSSLGGAEVSDAPFAFVLSREVCLAVYAALIGVTIVLALIRGTMFYKMVMDTSIRLHNNLFVSISKAKMWFFNNNTSGRILNRFSKDMGIIDEVLPTSLFDIIQIGLDFGGIVIVVATVNPPLLIPTGVIAIISVLIGRFYITTARSVKRLDGMTMSPVFSHANSSLQGLTTIRAFKAEKVLIQEFDGHQDTNTSAKYLYLGTSRAVAYWMDIFSLIYTGSVTLSFLMFGGGYFSGNVGLAITQSQGLTGNIQWVVRQVAELQSQMTSVERVLEYSKLEPEPNLETTPVSGKAPHKTWPEEGRVEFSYVHLRYSANEPWVLKGLNFTILPLEKVGVVGRTGAGKSSLISALFRLTEIEGSIVIDGIDTANISLHDLRAKLSIIPQEPVLFSGSLRKNLDPFDQCSDADLWAALDEVELKEVASELPGGLEAQISEGGANFSVGQRQLICLARAIVRKNKILVLDEATANVDIQTDSFIQETIREKFAECTVITVAHRLNTVMDSDKILVMDSGIVVEFDHPHILLQNTSGYLYSMVQKTGRSSADALMKTAAENYNKKYPQEEISTNLEENEEDNNQE